MTKATNIPWWRKKHKDALLRKEYQPWMSPLMVKPPKPLPPPSSSMFVRSNTFEPRTNYGQTSTNVCYTPLPLVLVPGWDCPAGEEFEDVERDADGGHHEGVGPDLGSPHEPLGVVLVSGWDTTSEMSIE